MNAIYIDEFNPPMNHHKNLISKIQNDIICKTQLDIKKIFIIPHYTENTNYNNCIDACKDFFNEDNVCVDNICGLIQPVNDIELIKYLKYNNSEISNNFYVIITVDYLEKIIKTFEKNSDDLNIILVGYDHNLNFHIYKSMSFVRYAIMINK